MQKNCPICGSDKTEIFSKYYFKSLFTHRYKCLDCGIIFSYPFINELELTKFYSENYSEFDGQQKLYCKENITKLIEDNKKNIDNIFGKTDQKKFRLLDAGCGPGTFSKAAEEIGWEVVSSELSGKNIEFCKNHLGLKNVYQISPDKLEYENYFHAVELWHVLEHVINAKSFLEKLNKMIVKNGIIHIGVPNIDNMYYKIIRIYQQLRGKIPDIGTSPEHTFEFNEKSLVLLLKKCGFKILKANIFEPENDLEINKTPVKYLIFKFIRIIDKLKILKIGRHLEILAEKL
ncbi:MAG TPA: class I SAM-dependent methyltransferase [bacterium]|nr:class I SAM-dependent methyltransferase [bacterium]